MITAKDLTERKWDVIVVGSGMGGGTIAYTLARAGKSVLICERGRSHLEGGDQVIGDDWAEAHVFADGAKARYGDYLRRAGRVTKPLRDVTGGGARAFLPVLGQGTGGSSAIYGMVLERFFPEDFEPARYFPGAVGASIPQTWPIGFDELAPFYTQAERLYRVRASVDPLRPAGETRGVTSPPPLSPGNAELAARFQARGLNPYHVPMACDYRPGCRECLGYICKSRCKGDSASICLEPATREHGAVLIDECEVERLVASGDQVSGLICRWRGERLALDAEVVVLAAGALETPAILLRSSDREHPRGLANRSDQVGRNLMRHFLDYYIVYPNPRPAPGDLVKQLAFNDLYVVDGEKYGTVQSNGRMPPARMIALSVREDLRAIAKPLADAFPLLRPLVEWGVRNMLSGSLVLAAFLEDLPYADNRVTLDAEGNVQVNYDIKPYDQARITAYRDMIAARLSPHRHRLLKTAEKNAVLGHMCGTCRFGEDPATSVLNRDNRTHDLSNLYVVDSSFLPTSSGTNPSLTIAANALRVGEIIAARLA